VKKKLTATSSHPVWEEFTRKRGVILIAMILGFAATIIHAALLPAMEIVAFLSFLGPVALGAYGVRTYRATKEKENEQAERDYKTDPLLG